MDVPTIDIRHKVEAINIYRGETLTVYMSKHRRHNLPSAQHTGKPIFEQVELRVTPNGGIEIFSDNIKTIIPFNKWYHCEKEDND